MGSFQCYSRARVPFIPGGLIVQSCPHRFKDVDDRRSDRNHINMMFELLPVWWTPPLSRHGDPLEFHRADIANGRVAPGRVVEAFDIIEHVGPGLVSCLVDLAGNPLGF